MGYPMSYPRMVGRGDLGGDYTTDRTVPGLPKVNREMVAGDLRRLENDQRDDRHLAKYALRTGLTSMEVRSVLDLFFAGLDGV